MKVRARGRRSGIGLFLLPVIIIGGVCVALVVLIVSDQFEFLSSFYIDSQKRIRRLWEAEDYATVIERAETILQKAPMDSNALVFGGLALFYHGIELPTESERREYMRRSIRLLRKTLLYERLAVIPEVYYTIAKAYYHSGPLFYDLSVSFMQQAIDRRFIADDSYEYLALANTHLKRYDDSIRNFQLAIETHPSEVLYLSLAEVYLQIGDYTQSRSYIARTIDSSDDEVLIQQARALNGKVLLELGQPEDAKAIFEELVEANPNSADNHYYLGRAFDLLGDAGRARYEWREAIRLDNGHRQALYNLQKN